MTFFSRIERSDHEHGHSVSTYGNWLGWGGNIYNNRWASSGAKVDVTNVGSLHPSCQIEYTVGISATPLVVNGVSYFPTWGGLLVALDYGRCTVTWQTNLTSTILDYKDVPPDILPIASLVSRTTPVNEGDVLFLGTLTNALLLAVDRRNGKVIDQI